MVMLDNVLYAVRLACSLQMFLLWHYEFGFFWFLLQDVAPSRLVRSFAGRIHVYLLGEGSPKILWPFARHISVNSPDMIWLSKLHLAPMLPSVIFRNRRDCVVLHYDDLHRFKLKNTTLEGTPCSLFEWCPRFTRLLLLLACLQI